MRWGKRLRLAATAQVRVKALSLPLPGHSFTTERRRVLHPVAVGPERFMKEANRWFRFALRFRRCGGKSDGFIQYLALDRGRGPVSAAVRRPRKDFGIDGR